MYMHIYTLKLFKVLHTQTHLNLHTLINNIRKYIFNNNLYSKVLTFK